MSKGIAEKITGHCFTIAGRDRTWRFYRKPCSGSAIFKLAELWADIWICKSIVLDLGILVITFGLSIKITIASIIGVLIAIIIYRFL